MQEEESCLESKHSAPISGPNKKDSPKPFTPNTSSSCFTPKPSSQNHNPSHSSNSKSTPKVTLKDKPKISIADKLGKNGKLPSDARECRMKKGVCLYCGEKDHVAHDCPKAQAARARSAKVSALEPKSDTVDSKK